MEMNFPHPALRQTAAHDRHDHKAMLAAAMTRQANSRTARAMAITGINQGSATNTKRDMVDQLIHYFGSGDHDEQSPSGAFFPAGSKQMVDGQISEPGIYQNASTNIKAHDLDDDGTGEQSNHPGHGASRTLC